MNRTNNILKAAVAAALGVAAGHAGAVVNFTTGTSAGAAKFANEIPTNTTAVGNANDSLAIKIAAPAGYAIDSAGSNQFFVKLQLTAGSSFKGTPIITCSANTGGATAVTGSITIGGAGDSAVTFNLIKAGDTATLSGFCTISAHTGIGVVTGTSRNVNVSATVEYKNGLSNVVSGVSGALITFVNGFTATFASAGGIVVDATSGSDNFVQGSAALTTALASAGLIRFDANGTSAATAGGAGNITLAEALGANSGSVTVSGGALAAALAANGVSGVFLDNNTANNCATKSYNVAATGTNTVTFSGIAAADLVSGLVVCLNVSGGTTQITTGTLTATVNASGAAANVTFGNEVPASGSLSTVTQNGTTKNAYFINASTSAAKTSVIRLINTGGSTGTIRATAYLVGDGVTGGVPNAVGTQVGTANATIATLSANQSVSVTSADLETLLGYTPANGTVKYRVVFSAGLGAFKVLNYTRDVAGGYITLSQAQDD